jgi:MFS family permease
MSNASEETKTGCPMTAVQSFVNAAKEHIPQWPSWTLNLMLIMGILLIITLNLARLFGPKGDNDNKKVVGKDDSSKKTLHYKFDVFRRKYLAVYAVIMLADWMQGTHMYTLYLSYNVNISALFLTGFLSGAIFAPFLGSLVDRYGRKLSCIIYCLLEIVINTLEHYDNFTVLIVGRVLGGISTNLLFSAFESWMTTEHRRKGFPDDWLQQTYSETSVVNGAMAILAGLVAQLLEDYFGHIGPFQGAIALTALAMVMVIFLWEENYGQDQQDESSSKDGAQAPSSLYSQFIHGWKATLSDSLIFRIGIIQALSEGAMYTFVFMWVPTMLDLNPPGGLPTGAVFSAFMMSITIGGLLFPLLESFMLKFTTAKSQSELTATVIYALASASMFAPALCLKAGGISSESGCFGLVLVSFVVMEGCVGLFMPVQGTLRSKYVPDSMQGAIMNIFRLPLNAVVVLGTYATDILPNWQVFSLVGGCLLCATLLQASMVGSQKKVAVVSSSKKDT